MPLRVAYTDVQDALETSLSASQITAFITDASLWVDQNLGDQGLASGVLAAIEKYLACYLCTLRDPQLKSMQLGVDVRDEYQRDPEVSEYLKAAIALDPTGRVEDAFGGADGRSRVMFRVGAGYAGEACP